MGEELNEAVEAMSKTIKKKKIKDKQEALDSIKDLEETLEFTDSTNAINNLSESLSVSMFDDENTREPLDLNVSEVINRIKEVESFMGIEDINKLLAYVRGGERPDFMDKMMTHTNEKLNESIKLMSIMQLLRLPALLEYQNTLTSTLLSKESLEKLTSEEMSRISTNVAKEISDIMGQALKVSSGLSNVNAIPTKVERLANALMYVSDSTRERIEEIIKQEG